MMRVGINGMGRIGRLIVRAATGAAQRPQDDPRQHNRLQVMHVNEIKGGAQATAHLLKFDSVQGRWQANIEAPDDQTLDIDGRTLGFFRAPNTRSSSKGGLGC